MAEKIAAVATGHARTGIGILRLSGDGCIEAAGQVFHLQSGKPLSSLPDRKLALGTLFDVQGRPIDHCMAFISRAPHSYTGEDTAEIQCHGSPAALAAGLEALFAAGFRQARPGEFTRRAFLNGRMDLTQAEAVIDLIDAETADAAANAAGQVAGAMRKRIDPVYDSWVDICAHFHAVLDYPDEDIDPFELSQLESALQASSRTLSALLSSCHRGRMVRSGVKITILGSPNAGKSSLLNALSGFDRVIVTDIPGTTRDTVEQTVTLGRHLLRLVDTAGIRDTEDIIEKIGVDRSVEAAKDCDAALFVVDDSQPSDRRGPPRDGRRARSAGGHRRSQQAGSRRCDRAVGSAVFVYRPRLMQGRHGLRPARAGVRHALPGRRAVRRIAFDQRAAGRRDRARQKIRGRCRCARLRAGYDAGCRAGRSGGGDATRSARSRGARCARISRTAFLSASASENKLIKDRYL